MTVEGIDHAASSVLGVANHGGWAYHSCVEQSVLFKDGQQLLEPTVDGQGARRAKQFFHFLLSLMTKCHGFKAASKTQSVQDPTFGLGAHNCFHSIVTQHSAALLSSACEPGRLGKTLH